MYSKLQNGRDVEDLGNGDDNDDKYNDDAHVNRILEVEICINIQCFWNVTSLISCAVLEMTKNLHSL